MLQRNDPCWCGSGKKWKKCHFPQKSGASPVGDERAQIAQKYLKSWGILIKSEEQIKKIEAACSLTAQILDKVCQKVAVGVTTEELDQYAALLHRQAGATPAPLGYGDPPYPKSICTSLNEVICHGIPDQVPLKEGDILNIDASAILDGYFGDCSRMVMVGNVSAEKRALSDVSYRCLMESIKILKPGVLVSEIAKVIEAIAKEGGCSVVDQFVGHGVGLKFHEPPQIPHHYNRIDIPLAAGMTFTIEPMINAGVRGGFIDEKNHWTARTLDLKPSAQWEHTLLITDQGHEILTLL